MSIMPIKITITDDHPLVVSGLQTILQNVQHIEVVATYGSGPDLLHGLEEVRPDVLLTDLQMPGKPSGAELIRAIRKKYADLPILVLSGQEALYHVHDIMAQGCMGYLLKNTTDPDMLVDAIEQIYRGNIFLEPSVRNEVLRSVLKTKQDTVRTTAAISRREREVLELIAQGYSSQEIADHLNLSVRTIDCHRLSLLHKLDAKNATGLVKKATDMGLLQ